MGYYLTVRVGHKIEDSGEERDSDISEKVVEHPFFLNPIVLSYVVFLAFTGVIIFSLCIIGRICSSCYAFSLRVSACFLVNKLVVMV